MKRPKQETLKGISVVVISALSGLTIAIGGGILFNPTHNPGVSFILTTTGLLIAITVFLILTKPQRSQS